MPREERKWHPNFMAYMGEIATHPNYRGLRMDQREDGTYRWGTTAQSEVGRARIAWCKDKARQLGIPDQPGVFAAVMLAIHPTKRKVCQTCGREMSLYYHYPNARFLEALNRRFRANFTVCDHIGDIWDSLVGRGLEEKRLAAFLMEAGDLRLNLNTATKDQVIKALEHACRKGGKSCLGPGAMSNFPDRFDGFHSYNRCCRGTQDRGRSAENMRTYTKDRRAYEYWSDGNIHAANRFMGSNCFAGTSADHVGPISLGFVHDPRYLRPMAGGDNSAKRDRLQEKDIRTIVEIEAHTGVCPMSWYSRVLWEHIKANYADHPEHIAGPYRDALKQNMANFMFILWRILKNCPDQGEKFLVEAFLAPHDKDFQYAYRFNKNGEILHKMPRHMTASSQGEIDRYRRVAIEAVYDYNDKENRNVEQNLTPEEIRRLGTLYLKIFKGAGTEELKADLQELMKAIQRRAIRRL